MLAFTNVGTVVAGWGVTVAGFAVYALWMRRRARMLSDLVPPEDRRWS